MMDLLIEHEVDSKTMSIRYSHGPDIVTNQSVCDEEWNDRTSREAIQEAFPGHDVFGTREWVAVGGFALWPGIPEREARVHRYARGMAGEISVNMG